jgi:hypothetical protein
MKQTIITVVGLMIIVATVITLIIIAIIKTADSYSKALDTCIDNGYSREYCEMMLN